MDPKKLGIAGAAWAIIAAGLFWLTPEGEQLASENELYFNQEQPGVEKVITRGRDRAWRVYYFHAQDVHWAFSKDGNWAALVRYDNGILNPDSLVIYKAEVEKNKIVIKRDQWVDGGTLRLGRSMKFESKYVKNIHAEALRE